MSAAQGLGFPGPKKWLAGWLAAALFVSSTGLHPLLAADAPASPAPTIAQVLTSLRPDLARVADTEALARATAALQLASEL